MKTSKMRLFRGLSLLLIIGAMAAALFVGVQSMPSQASSCHVWYRCPVTQRYGQNQEHGVDLWTQGKAITALLPGKVTAVHLENWERPRPMTITWRLDKPVCWHGRCAGFMYVQIRTSSVWVGEHIKAGQMLGWSYSFIEIGFCLFPAYGHWPYPWRYSGIDPLRIFPYL